MNLSELVVYAQSLSVPVNSSWSKAQILSVIDDYRTLERSGRTLWTFIATLLMAVIAQSVYPFLISCESGLCHVDGDEHHSNSTIESPPIPNPEPISDAVERVLDEMISVVNERQQKTHATCDAMKESLIIAQESLAKCTSDVAELKAQNDRITQELSDCVHSAKEEL